MKKNIITIFALTTILAFGGCGGSGDSTNGETESNSQNSKNTKDTYTVGNLEWQDTAEVLSEDVDFDNIDQYCESQTLSGFTDWRVPTLKEYQALYPHKDALQYSWNKDSYLFWTSSKGGVPSNLYVRIFNMSNGGAPVQFLKLIEQYKHLGGYPTRCVRLISNDGS